MVAGAIATAMIPPGSRLALGTGSTVEAALAALAAIPDLVATPTSEIIADRAAAAGIKLVPVQSEYDIYLDGADQVAPTGDVIKGSWGAHVREKTLAELSVRRILICDESKLVDKLVGPVPVAVVPYFSILYSGSAETQTDDNGLKIVPMGAGEVIDSPADWDREICRKAGVVMTGLFPAGFVEQIIIGNEDGSHRIIMTAPIGA
ncbi:ribose-5-phosphate isomerase A [Streptomyces sp. NPDC059340]|uniref:ribose-5-phosphate isomerase A n=1 Tax=Streptomyces sp. NPDC059340 TaxID=3346806 RepID=UPI00367CA6F0